MWTWTKTLESEIELTLGEKPQLFQQLVFYKHVSSSSCLRLNIQSTNGQHKALVHLQQSELDDVFSRLVYEEKSESNREELELFIKRLQSKAEHIEELEPPRQLVSGNWRWELLDSEFTEFGIEETWRARWRRPTSQQLKRIELQIHWFHGTIHTIPSFTSIEVMQVDLKNSIELYYVELPVDNRLPQEESQRQIERRVEDMLITPLDLMVHLLLT